MIRHSCVNPDTRARPGNVRVITFSRFDGERLLGYDFPKKEDAATFMGAQTTLDGCTFAMYNDKGEDITKAA